MMLIRHLTALRTFRHMGKVLEAGDPFYTDDVGANYYLTRKVAKEEDAENQDKATAPEQAQVVPAKRGRGRPRKHPAVG
jgi:hypothetical protein